MGKRMKSDLYLNRLIDAKKLLKESFEKLSKEGRNEEAEQVLRTLLCLEPNNVDIQKKLGLRKSTEFLIEIARIFSQKGDDKHAAKILGAARAISVSDYPELIKDYETQREFQEQRLAAAEREKAEPSVKLIGLEKVTLRFSDDDTKIKLEGYVAAYSNREVYVNFTNIESTTSKYDDIGMRFTISDYKVISKPITIRELKEKAGKYIKLGKAETKKKLNLKTIKRAIKFEPAMGD